MLCTVTVTEQEACTTRLSNPAMILSLSLMILSNGSASEQQSTGQQEKLRLNVKINTNIATRLQNLEV